MARLYYRIAARFCGLLAFNQVMPDGCAPYLLLQDESTHE